MHSKVNFRKTNRRAHKDLTMNKGTTLWILSEVSFLFFSSKAR